jgi:hypothetical protein
MRLLFLLICAKDRARLSSVIGPDLLGRAWGSHPIGGSSGLLCTQVCLRRHPSLSDGPKAGGCCSLERRVNVCIGGCPSLILAKEYSFFSIYLILGLPWVRRVKSAPYSVVQMTLGVPSIIKDFITFFLDQTSFDYPLGKEYMLITCHCGY